MFLHFFWLWSVYFYPACCKLILKRIPNLCVTSRIAPPSAVFSSQWLEPDTRRRDLKETASSLYRSVFLETNVSTAAALFHRGAIQVFHTEPLDFYSSFVFFLFLVSPACLHPANWILSNGPSLADVCRTTSLPSL